MKVSLGFSPCPNDTFIFDALANKRIDTQGIDFEILLEDVQTLNNMALELTLDFSKISYGVLPLVLDKYILLNSGSALGSGVGPLLISKDSLREDEVNYCKIAVPGANTTAHMLFKLAYPQATDKIFLRYDEIEDFVLAESKEKRAGVIIHENRFTYKEKGLNKIVDLGNFWEEKTQLPIPLGGIVAKRSLDINLVRTVNGLIKESVDMAFQRYPELTDYIRKHSQEMSETVMRQHIDLYVNDYSIDLGKAGKNAIQKFLHVNDPNQIIRDDLFVF